MAAHRVGAGRPVLLVHGWTGFKEVWRDLPQAIAAAGREAIALDLPGWGDSPAPRFFSHSPAAYAGALLRAVDAVGPCAIVAHSMGAQAAILVARARPAAVERLVLIGPALTPFRPIAVPPRSLRDLVRYPLIGVPLMRLILLVLRRDRDRWRRSYERAVADPRRLAADPAFAALLDLACRRLTRTSTATLARSAPGLLGFDARDLAADIRQPTLVVIGTEDGVVAPSAVIALARLLPAGRVLRVPGAGHFPHFEDPQRTIPAVVAALTDPSR